MPMEINSKGAATAAGAAPPPQATLPSYHLVGYLLGTKISDCARFHGYGLRQGSAVVILVVQAASSAFPDRKGKSSVWCEKQKHL